MQQVNAPSPDLKLVNQNGLIEFSKSDVFPQKSNKELLEILERFLYGSELENVSNRRKIVTI